MAKVKAAVVEAPGKISIQEFPFPEVSKEDGLLKVDMVGVCGSDPKYFYGRFAHRRNFPLILGHEIVGTIAKVGSEAAKRWGVQEGDRVVVEGSFGCGYCPMCLAGAYRLCKNSLGYGNRIAADVPPHLWGGFSEYLYLAPQAIVHKIDPEVTLEAGSLICAVIANGVRWVEAGGVRFGDVVVVQGVGAQGLALITAAKESGAAIVIAAGLARDRDRLKMALTLGADYAINVEEKDLLEVVAEITHGNLADVVFDVTGSTAAPKISFEIVKPLGRIVQAGLNGGKMVPLELDKIVWKEVSVQGVYSYDYRSVKAAIKLVESRKYPLDKIVTHYFKLEEAETALKATAGEIELPGLIKAVIVPIY
ncbi:MAG: alcohol dehydrogenase [Clostridia bacterium]|nr:alcohol dehydrogenase [Clostridia bacterium]